MIEKDTKSEAVLRLKKIEGQVRGIQKMIESDRHHYDITIQLSSAEKAINRVKHMLLKGQIESRVSELALRGNNKDKIDELVNTLFGLVK